MIAKIFLPIATFALLAACGQQNPDPTPEELTRAAIDKAGRIAASAPDTPQSTAQEEDTNLPDVFDGMIPWDDARENLISTESGLQIHVLEAGDKDGSQPGINDRISVNYDGRLAEDGTKFDSSYDRGQPAQFGVTQVIPGWTETLQLMRPGDDWLVYIPADLAYGAQGTPGGPIGPNADLIFRVMLEEIIADTTPGGEIWEKHYPWNTGNTDIQTTESGLEYIVLERGEDGGELVLPEMTIVTDFEIRLADDGRRVESSYGTGRPYRAPVSQLFPGWQEAMQLMRPGDDFLFRMTPTVAFGEEAVSSGQVPPGDVLMRVNLKEAITPLPPQVSNSEAWETYTPWESDREEVVKAEWGVEYIVIEAGDEAGPLPNLSSTVEVYYEGRLTTGETFDSAYERGESIEFPVTGVIKGWTDTLQNMRPGDRWLVYIPANLAYGDNPRPGGIIKPGDDLIFEMQLIDLR